MFITEARLEKLLQEFTACKSFAEMKRLTDTGYVPTITTRTVFGALIPKRLELVAGLKERGIKVFTGN